MPGAPQSSSQDGVTGDPERKKSKTFFGNGSKDASSSETSAPLPVLLKLSTMSLNKHICNIAYRLEERLEGKTVEGDNF